jgi:elongator complex protein 2
VSIRPSSRGRSSADNGSADQTSRMHAPTRIADTATWSEIARPQIHGYDMTDAAFISPFRFASSGDEKVTRVFDAPGGFVESLQALGVSNDAQDVSLRPKGATVPPLGLSNRALGKAAEVSDHPTPPVANPAIDSVSKAFTALPTEEELSTTTLWPEVEKVYGHGYEVSAGRHELRRC